jgi:hypothetical protein
MNGSTATWGGTDDRKIHALVLALVGRPLDVEAAMSEHELKVWPPHFEHLLDGRKRFEVRKNDRRFKVGDAIKFREFVPKMHAAAQGQDGEYYTGRNLWMRVRYVLNPRPDRDPDCGLVAGYVVLDLEPINLAEYAP